MPLLEHSSSTAELPISLPFERLRARNLALGTAIFSVLAVFAVGVATSVLFIHGLAAAWALRLSSIHGISLHRLFGPAPKRQEWALLWLTLPLMGASFGGMWLLFAPLSFVAPDFVTTVLLTAEHPILIPGAAGRNLAFIGMLVIVAPVTEEFIFRGVLFHRWVHKWGKWRGLWFSSVAFGVLHIDPIGAVVFGVVMTLIYIRSQSLWIPIATHMLNNGAAMIGTLMEGDGAANYGLAEFRADWWLGAVGAVALLMLYATRHRWGPTPHWKPPYDLPALMPSDHKVAEIIE